MNHPGYNPQEYVIEHKVLRRLDVASKGARKEFRRAERERLTQMDEEQQQSPNKPRTSRVIKQLSGVYC